ncbi:isocitrate lyase [Brenneria izbisi]|uniref:Isocitrate lyase n=1 Tax=Brenneria izbisi TaxID=2939450 RepID=A0AA42C162_9GAMM|nr:isocitrate lyase [Brenneria izbisi]MCV9878242.1 isocitrate lyase [Brenneria izbisi]MCV9881665.1 isocitrate lyase [Brenneria izbisi]
MTTSRTQQIQQLEQEWKSARWEGIARPYRAEDVISLRGSVNPECTLAQLGAARLWKLLHGESRKGYVNCLGALTGGQALQQAKAGIEAIYLSGWQVAADANLASSMYPDQSLYPANSVPAMVERINNTFRRADQIQWANQIEPGDKRYTDYFLPIVADAEAGFGGVLNAFELMKSMIEAGAAAVHFEDQLASVKKCGHMGGKVLVPSQEAIQKLVAARLAADVLGVPTLLVARTDADAADLLTSDCDEYDQAFITGERTAEGFYRTHAGVEQAISRGLAYAPYADLVWCETSTPDLEVARRFAQAIHARYPGKLLAYNCSPSFNWKKNLDDRAIARFQDELSAMGYKYQFITLAGIHSMWFNMFDLAHAYAQGEGMKHYVEKVQQPEFDAIKDGYTFSSHQQEVGTGYFDKVTNIIQGGISSVTALTGSTEEQQF